MLTAKEIWLLFLLSKNTAQIYCFIKSLGDNMLYPIGSAYFYYHVP